MIEQGQPESAWVAEQIGRPVSKAFNNPQGVVLESRPGALNLVRIPFEPLE